MLDVHVAGRAQVRERRLHLRGHRARAADEELVDAGGVEVQSRELAHLVAVDAAVEQRHVLRFAAHHEAGGEPRQEAVLQREHVVEQHRAGGARIAVVELEAAVRLALQQGRGDRQHRRDAAAGREGRAAPRARRLRARLEAAIRRHDLERVARLRAREVLRHAPAGLHAERDRERGRALRTHDRIGAPLLLAADRGAHRDVLAGAVAELRRERGRDREAERDGVVRDRAAVRDRERMELQHVRCT